MTTVVESRAKPDRSALSKLYDGKSVRGVTAIDRIGLQIHHASLVGLKAANEDRIAVQECDLGVLIAIFDGHYTDELSDYAAKVLPQQLCERIARNVSSGDGLSAAVQEALSKGIQDFDTSLIDEVYNLFPEGRQTDWDDAFWDDPYWILDTLGHSKENEKFRRARRAVVGSTALIAFIDQAKENIWVASLGDSEAVLGRVVDGTVSGIALNDLHNVKNPQEVARLQAEHRGEPPVIYDGRTMRQLGLTRALGDYQMKTDYKFAFKFLMYLYPSPIIDQQFEFWKERGLEHYHPPYISNVPTVQHRSLLPGDRLVLASDGLRNALTSRGVEDDKVPSSIIALAASGAFEVAASLQTLSDRLGHELLPSRSSSNVADLVIRNALFGTNEGKIAEELALVDGNPEHRYRDDISIVVVDRNVSPISAQTTKNSAHALTTTSLPSQPSRLPSSVDSEATYASLATRGITAVGAMSIDVHYSSLRGVKPANEDRIAIQECDLGVLIAIFDGHLSDELSDYAAKILPQQLCERIASNLSQSPSDISTAVEAALTKGIEDFDASLINEVYKLFPDGAATDWSDEYWEDPFYVYERIGRSKEDERFRRVRRAVVGTTALVAFVDKESKYAWVASLGDSEAVLGRVDDEGMHFVALNELHNSDNPAETARLQAEHPNEPPVVYEGRTLDWLAVTRALGDFQAKVPLDLAVRILDCAFPSYLLDETVDAWKSRGHVNPPYISSTPTIQRYALLPGDHLVLASDGLRNALTRQGVVDNKVQSSIGILAAANAHDVGASVQILSDQLGHDFLPVKIGENMADLVIRNALFGTNETKRAEELALAEDNPEDRYRDDISIVVLAFGGRRPSDCVGDPAQETSLVPTTSQPSSAPSLADLEATYAAMCTRGIITIEAMGLEIHQSSLRGLKAASEDRISICESEFGVLIAIFDGHYTDELSSYAANVLPQQLCDRISRNISSGGGADISTAVEEALVKGIEDFDASLLDNVLKHFPQGADTDWDDPLWDDPAEVFDIFGYSREDPVFVAARRTIVGSTALVGFIDREKKNLWVASLGDSEAVLGRVVDDHLQCEVLNDLHNVDNPVEVARLQAEHLNEPPVVYNGRTMGKLAITRALGDFHLKVGLRLSTRVLSYAYPSYLGTNIIEDWQRRWNFHPPYISSTPTVHRHALLPGDVLLFASDGLRMSLEAVPIEDARTQAMVALAVTGNPSLKPVLTRLRDQLGHDFIPISQSTNSADFVIRNALFGADLNKMAAELALTGTSERYRDDISVVIVDLQG